MNSWVISTSLIGLVVLGACLLWRHISHKPHSLTPVNVGALYHFSPLETAADDCDDALLWDTVGGLRGLRAIAGNARYLSEIVATMVPEHEELYPELKRLHYKTLEIVICVFFTILEAMIAGIIPRFPRLHARVAVQLYIEIAMQVRAICDGVQPELAGTLGLAL